MVYPLYGLKFYLKCFFTAVTTVTVVKRTFDGIDLALEDICYINNAIQKLDYIQIIFIFRYLITECQLQRCIKQIVKQFSASVTHQREISFHICIKKYPMITALCQGTSQAYILKRKLQRFCRRTYLFKKNLQRRLLSEFLSVKRKMQSLLLHSQESHFHVPHWHRYCQQSLL